jgi:arylformamidase
MKLDVVLSIPAHQKRKRLSKFIDISLPLQAKMPIWPGSVGFHLTHTKRLEDGDQANISRLDSDVHVGTHIDAPSHFVKGGLTVEQLSLDILIGLAVVAYLPEIDAIKAQDLDNLSLPSGTQRLLLRTRNSDLWPAQVTEFKKDFVALTNDAAHWIVKNGICLIGIDYLSIQRYNDDSFTHNILLKAGVIIIEGLNLASVQPGVYELICLPLCIVGAEGSPARAVLHTMSG